MKRERDSPTKQHCSKSKEIFLLPFASRVEPVEAGSPINNLNAEGKDIKTT